MRFVERKGTHFTQAKSDREEHDSRDIDPIIITKLSAHAKMAEEMKQSHIDQGQKHRLYPVTAEELRACRI
jgi:hypothetical protein